jgi:hypothetical protein
MHGSAINHRASRPALDGAPLDTAIDEARAELAALLRAPGGGEPSRLTEACAVLGSLGQSGLHNLLELELLNRADVPGGSWGPGASAPPG